MNTRIKILRKTLGLTLAEFGSKIGMKHSTISDFENGHTNITDRVILLICTQFNVNEKWLREGVGEMFNVNKNFQEFFKIYSQLKSPLQDYILECIKILLDTQNRL